MSRCRVIAEDRKDDGFPAFLCLDRVLDATTPCREGMTRMTKLNLRSRQHLFVWSIMGSISTSTSNTKNLPQHAACERSNLSGQE